MFDQPSLSRGLGEGLFDHPSSPEQTERQHGAEYPGEDIGGELNILIDSLAFASVLFPSHPAEAACAATGRLLQLDDTPSRPVLSLPFVVAFRGHPSRSSQASGPASWTDACDGTSC